jgi:hypothetical protein
VRLWVCLLPSLAIHAAVVVAISLRGCAPPAPAQDLLPARVVDIDIASPPPPAAAPAKAAPGGGIASRARRHAGHAPVPAPPPKPRPVQEPSAPEAEAPAPDPDAVPPSPTATADPGPPAARANAATGAGPGQGGGPGGPGRGGPAAHAVLPTVTRKGPFGRGDFGDFKGVVCLIAPGTLRIADVRSCQPVAVIYTDRFNIPGQRYDDGFPGVTGRSTWFLIDYRGTFAVSKEGTYQFRLCSDDGTYLYIDDDMVIENDGKHDPISRSGSVVLRPGRHRLRLLYAQTTDWMALQLFVRTPGSWLEKLFTSQL